jgi:DNA polymerase-1
MISIDLSQAENRVVAYIANELRMIEAFEKGIDIHKETASLIFGIPYDQVSDEPGSCDLGGGLFSQRYWGKKANHALNYDLGQGQFALKYETSQSEAKFIIGRYHSAYPGVRQWHAAVREKLRRDHRLTDCFGNTRIFMDRWGDDMFKSAYSYIPQSTVARKLNRDGLVYAYKQYAGTPLCLLNQVYDSLVMEFPLDDIAGISSAVWDIKCNLETPIEFHGRSFSIPVDTKIGFNLKDMKEIKSKDFQKPEDLEAQLENFLLEAGNEPKA